MTPSFDIVIAAYNAPHWVCACLESIALHTDGDYRVHLVADGCEPWVVARLREQLAELWPEDRYTCSVNEQNEGYLKAANRGVAQGDADYVVVLNSDTLVTPNWLQGLHRCLESDPSIGIACPLASWANFTRIGFPAGATFLEVAKLVGQHSPRRYPEIGLASGFCFAVRREIFRSIGSFDEIYGPGYYEESDFCMRAHEQGWRIVADDGTFIFHHGWASFGDSGRNDWMERNRAIFERRWGRAHDMWAQRMAESDLWADLTRTIQEAVGSDGMRIKGNRTLGTNGTGGVPPEAAHGDGPRVLFMLPSLEQSGGVVAVLQLINKLLLRGVRAQAATCGRAVDSLYKEQLFFRPYVFEDRDAMLAGLPRFDVVVSTRADGLADAHALAERWNAAVVHSSQGVETSFTAPPGTDPTSLERGLHHVVKTSTARDAATAVAGAVHHVPASINRDIFYPAAELPAAGPWRVVMPVRPGVPTRGAATLAEIAAALKDRRDDVELAYAWGKPQNAPAGQCLGQPTQTQLAATLRTAAIFVEPFLEQTVGRAGLEAMASGVPAVLSSRGGVNDYASNDVNCLQVPPYDVQAAVLAVERLLDDRALAARLRDAGLSAVSERDLDREVEQMLGVFKQVLGPGVPAPDQVVLVDQSPIMAGSRPVEVRTPSE